MKDLKCLVVALALVSACSLASGQVFSENFDSYASGSALHGQGGWKGWDNTPGAGAPTSSKYAYSGKNSVEIIGTADLVHEFKVAAGRYEFSAMQYIPKGSTGSTFFILMNQYADGGAGNDWSIQLNYNMDSGVVTAEQQGGNATADIVYDRWVEVKFRIDLIENTCEYYYAGALVKTHPWDDNAHGTLQAIDLYGNNASSVYYDDIKITQYYRYKASQPKPADGAVGMAMPLLQWTKGDTGFFRNIYFGTSPDLTEANLVRSMASELMYFHVPGFQPGVRYYWRVDEIEADGKTIYTGDVWSFIATPVVAFSPTPADGGEGVGQAVTLRWQPATTAVNHHVYFGDDPDAVEAGVAAVDKGTTADTFFNAGLLRAGTTYYWRIDEIDPAGSVQAGAVWAFTTMQPVAGRVVREWWTDIAGTAVNAMTQDARYPNDPTGRELVRLFEGPVNWKENYGSRLYGWLKPAKSGQYTFWISSDDMGELWLSTDADPAHAALIASVSGWTNSRDFDNGSGQGGANQKSAVITLTAGQKYYIEALMKEGGGGDNIAVAWQPPGEGRDVIPGEFVDTFSLMPLKAAAPSPRNGAVNTVQSPVLSWLAGEKATQHDVYFGADAAAVAAADATSPLYQGRQKGTTFAAGDLAWAKTCYWRVDEVAEGDPASPWKGTVWSFTTADFIPVDDFESYTDDIDAGEALYQTWVDGLTNQTGSYVGYENANGGTFGEIAVVHGGRQSMPLAFNNAEAPYYSETERAWSAAQDWTAGGVTTLVLSVRGKTISDPAVLYVALEDSAGKSAVVAHPDNTVVASAQWVDWAIPLSDFTGVNAAKIKKMFIGVGSRNAAAAGGKGVVYIDDIRAVKP